MVRPETAGVPVAGADPLCFQFDTWLGDELVRAHPHFLTTTAFRNGLQELPSGTGFSFAPASVRTSSFFRGHSRGRRLPRFWQLLVRGRAGVDDMGLTRDGSLVVSLRVFETMMAFTVRRASVSQYVPGQGAPLK